MEYLGIDHVVLTVKSIQKSVHFYCHLLGFTEITFGKGRKAAQCGSGKINFHEKGSEYQPHAKYPTPGSADLCFIVATPLEKVVSRLSKANVNIVEGPVERTGAKGKIMSLYLRDPDHNLIELSNDLER